MGYRAHLVGKVWAKGRGHGPVEVRNAPSFPLATSLSPLRVNMTWQAAGCEARADECHYSPDYSGHGIVMDGFEGEIEVSGVKMQAGWLLR